MAKDGPLWQATPRYHLSLDSDSLLSRMADPILPDPTSPTDSGYAMDTDKDSISEGSDTSDEGEPKMEAWWLENQFSNPSDCTFMELVPAGPYCMKEFPAHDGSLPLPEPRTPHNSPVDASVGHDALASPHLTHDLRRELETIENQERQQRQQEGHTSSKEEYPQAPSMVRKRRSASLPPRGRSRITGSTGSGINRKAMSTYTGAKTSGRGGLSRKQRQAAQAMVRGGGI